MAMPDKKTTRALLASLTERPAVPGWSELVELVQALADAEWAREEAAEAQALLAADLANQAEREHA